MARNSEFQVELLKLKKEYLIEIILNKKLPSGAVTSPELQKFIEDSACGSTSEISITSKHNQENVLEKLTLESELKLARQEIVYLQKLTRNLEKTVSDKDQIINLLKPKQQKQSKQSVSSVECDVAGKTTLSEIYAPEQNVQKSDDSTVRPQKVIKHKVKNSNRKSEIKEIRGSDRSQTSFGSAPKRAWLYVGHVEEGVDSTHIERHLKMKFPEGQFQVEGLVSNEHSTGKSFKVGANIELLEKLYEPDIWPHGIIVKKFRFFRKPIRARQNWNEENWK